MTLVLTVVNFDGALLRRAAAAPVISDPGQQIAKVLQ